MSHALPKTRDQKVMGFYGWESLKVIHHPAKFGGHWYSGSGNIMLLIAEDKNSDALAWIRHYWLFLNDMRWKHTAYHIINSDPGHTLSKQQKDENLNITFASPFKITHEKNKETKNNCKAFCVTRKHDKLNIWYLNKIYAKPM